MGTLLVGGVEVVGWLVVMGVELGREVDGKGWMVGWRVGSSRICKTDFIHSGNILILLPSRRRSFFPP